LFLYLYGPNQYRIISLLHNKLRILCLMCDTGVRARKCLFQNGLKIGFKAGKSLLKLVSHEQIFYSACQKTLFSRFWVLIETQTNELNCFLYSSKHYAHLCHKKKTSNIRLGLTILVLLMQLRLSPQDYLKGTYLV
jgi:hypothetical protein